MPSRLIKKKDGVRAGRDRKRDFLQMKRHGLQRPQAAFVARFHEFMHEGGGRREGDAVTLLGWDRQFCRGASAPRFRSGPGRRSDNCRTARRCNGCDREGSRKRESVHMAAGADHEQNPSTSTVRLAGSSGANPHKPVDAPRRRHPMVTGRLPAEQAGGESAQKITTLSGEPSCQPLIITK
jgi:Citrate synthase, C-terminal domain